LCDCSVHKRITTERPFIFESNWRNVGTSRQKQSQTSEKKITIESQNTAISDSNLVPGSRATRSQVALTSSASRNDGDNTAASSKKSSSSKASRQNSVVSVVSSVSTDRAKQSTESDARSSHGSANSTKTKTTSVTDAKTATGNKQSSYVAGQENSVVSTLQSSERLKNSAKSKDNFFGTGGVSITGAGRKDTNQSTAKSLKSNAHYSNHQNSAANSERAQRQVESHPEKLVGETNFTEPHRVFANVAHGEAFNISGIVETVGTGVEILHHETVSSNISSTASRKSSANKNLAAKSIADVKAKNVNSNGMSDLTEVSSSTATGNVPVINSSLSSVVVSQQSVIPLSSETMANKHVSDIGGAVASVHVATLGNQSNVSSARTQSVSQSRQAAKNVHIATSVAASCTAVSSDQASNTANMDVVRSGKKMVANRLNAASNETQSAAQIRQTSSVAETGSAAAALELTAR